MNPSHIERIKELFLKLKQGHDWCQRNQHNQARIEELFKRSETIFQELESLGVSREFSQALFIFGPLMTNELVNQFREGGENKSYG